MDGDDRRARAAQLGAVEPGRVEDVGAARVVGLVDHVLGSCRLEERVEQAGHVAPDSPRVRFRSAVVRDPHATESLEVAERAIAHPNGYFSHCTADHGGAGIDFVPSRGLLRAPLERAPRRGARAVRAPPRLPDRVPGAGLACARCRLRRRLVLRSAAAGGDAAGRRRCRGRGDPPRPRALPERRVRGRRRAASCPTRRPPSTRPGWARRSSTCRTGSPCWRRSTASWGPAGA